MLKNTLPISALILTYNEEENISRTINALKRLDQVIVLDSGSTDRTAKIVQEFPNATLHVRPFDSMMNQWNFGHSLASHDWILSLDADYRVSTELLDEISQLDLTKTGYEAPFRYCIYGHPIRSAVLPPRIIYYNRHLSKYIQDGHTQKLVAVEENVGKLQNPIFHDDRKNLNRWLWSQQVYSGQELTKLMHSQDSLSFVDRLRKKTFLTPFLIFFYCFIWKGGILEGRKGLFYAVQRLYAETILVMRIMDQKIEQTEKPNNKSN
jgi:glycosyltransferase involved in cell wall biosynthesis